MSTATLPPAPFHDAQTPDELIWSELSAQNVVDFYGHGKKQPFKSFSNFYTHKEIPFRVPDSCWSKLKAACPHSELQQTVMVAFSEKSIMLCKAAVMGDAESYVKIQQCMTPGEAKKLGRRVQNFDLELWHSVILQVAYQAVIQKFYHLQAEFLVLCKTGTALIVEAARNDVIWGIGKPAGHADCQNPATWAPGCNILGWALMKARRDLIAQEIATERNKTST